MTRKEAVKNTVEILSRSGSGEGDGEESIGGDK
jgi:hypothetical protein